MKTLHKTVFAIAFVALLVSCEQKTNTNEQKINTTKALSKPETRKEIMDSIANNNDMSKEMIDVMMNSQNGEKWLQENDKLKTMMRGSHGGMIE